jgi:hypothetical protein
VDNSQQVPTLAACTEFPKSRVSPLALTRAGCPQFPRSRRHLASKMRYLYRTHSPKSAGILAAPTPAGCIQFPKWHASPAALTPAGCTQSLYAFKKLRHSKLHSSSVVEVGGRTHNFLVQSAGRKFADTSRPARDPVPTRPDCCQRATVVAPDTRPSRRSLVRPSAPALLAPRWHHWCPVKSARAACFFPLTCRLTRPFGDPILHLMIFRIGHSLFGSVFSRRFRPHHI